MSGQDDIDERSSMLYNTTPETLSAESGRWPRPVGAPEPVQAMLLRARRLFVGGAASYDGFVAAEFAALQAAELSLRDLLGFPPQSKATFGMIAKSERAVEVLTKRQVEWFNDYAVPFRNAHAHPDRAVAVSPGMAALLLAEVHRVIAELYATS